MAPQVSVVIPVRNRERMISRCLETVLSQTLRDYEVIVVDNASTDGTKDAILRFRDADKRVRYVHEPKVGIGSARRAGELAARGQVILMTDSDCEVPGDWIEKMAGPVLGGEFPAVQGMKRAAQRNYWTAHTEREEHMRMRSFFSAHGTSEVDTANFCIDSRVLRSVGYTDGEIADGNDIDLGGRIHAKGYAVKLIETSVGHHHPEGPLKLAGKLFRRGMWYVWIRERYGDSALFSRETPKLFAGYVVGLASEAAMMKKNFAYHLVTGISWRFGLLCGRLKKPA